MGNNGKGGTEGERAMAVRILSAQNKYLYKIPVYKTIP